MENSNDTSVIGYRACACKLDSDRTSATAYRLALRSVHAVVLGRCGGRASRWAHNVRAAPNGPPLMALVNGTPIVPLGRRGEGNRR